MREATATARTVDADHGRIEARTAAVSTAIAWLQADYKSPGPPPMSRVLHRTLLADPMLATRGEGIYLHTADGRKIIDGSGGAAVACLGHDDNLIDNVQAMGERLMTGLTLCRDALRHRYHRGTPGRRRG